MSPERTLPRAFLVLFFRGHPLHPGGAYNGGHSVAGQSC